METSLCDKVALYCCPLRIQCVVLKMFQVHLGNESFLSARCFWSILCIQSVLVVLLNKQLQQLPIRCIRGFSVAMTDTLGRDLIEVFILASGSSSWVYNGVGRHDSRWLEREGERAHLQQQTGSRAKELEVGRGYEPSRPWWQTSSSKAAPPRNLAQ